MGCCATGSNQESRGQAEKNLYGIKFEQRPLEGKLTPEFQPILEKIKQRASKMKPEDAVMTEENIGMMRAGLPASLKM